MQEKIEKLVLEARIDNVFYLKDGIEKKEEF